MLSKDVFSLISNGGSGKGYSIDGLSDGGGSDFEKNPKDKGVDDREIDDRGGDRRFHLDNLPWLLLSVETGVGLCFTAVLLETC